MKSSFPLSIKLVAFCTVLIFAWNQTVFADGLLTQEYNPPPIQLAVSATDVLPEPIPQNLPDLTTTDFVMSAGSPLSPATSEEGSGGGGGPLTLETTSDGHTIRHIYEGELIQTAVDQSEAGDVVFVHDGTYHESITLKQGVNLTGEDSAIVILDGQNQFTDVILALGDNVIQGITVKGGSAYSGPKSAIRIEGSHVILRDSRIVDNADYGVYLRSGNNILIERVFFKGNHLAIQHPSTAASNVVIRYNTLVNNNIGINILSGVTPRIENNIITGSSFCAIYEFNWTAYASGQLSRGFATVENNTFFSNAWRGTAYGSSTPPAVENLSSGDIRENPQFNDSSNGDYSVTETSPAFGRGAFLPEVLEFALDRALSVQELTGTTYAIEEIFLGEELTGWSFTYGEGLVETFYEDGTMQLDITPPEIVILSTIVLTNQSTYQFVYTVDGVEHSETRSLLEGENYLAVDASDIIGNEASKSYKVRLDTIAPAIVINPGTPTLINEISITIQYTADGVTKEQTFADLIEGENALTIIDVDEAGNESSKNWIVTVDAIAPELVVTSPVPSLTNDASLVVDYTVDGEVAQETFTLVEGDNAVLTITEVDAAGNVRTITLSNVVLDTVAPVIVVTSFVPSLTNDVSLVVDYTVDGVVNQETFTLVEGANAALTITETDLAGNVRTITLSNVVLDTTAPVVVVDPATLSKIGVDHLTVSYSLDGTVKTKEFTGLVDGANALKITETDEFGRTTEVPFTVTADLSAPVVVVDPATLSKIGVDHLTVSYALDGTVKTKEFTGLVDGANALKITETDEFGRSTEVPFTVTADLSAPVVVIDSATPSKIGVDHLVVSYTLDGVVKTKEFTGLIDGANALKITETDEFGRSTEVPFTVTADLSAPVVVIDSATPSKIGVDHLVVSYTLDGVVKTKEFTGLIDGANALKITETDEFGRSTEVPFTVTADLSAPVVVIDPATPSKIGVDHLVVSYTLDGVVKTKEFTGLAEGPNTLTISETDEFERTVVSESFVVTVDTTAPVVMVTSFVPSLTNDASLVVDYTVDGVVNQETFTLVEGDNAALTITETDLAGNVRTITLSNVVLDTVAPVIVVTSSVPGLTNEASLVVDYTVDGEVAQKTFTLVEGDSAALTITETDLAGNPTSFTLSNVTLDTVAPVIVIDPATLALINETSITIQYTADGVTKEQAFTDLGEGENILILTESDEVGNEATASWVVTVDMIPPEVIFTSSAVTDQAVYQLIYTVDGMEQQETWHLASGENQLLVRTSLEGAPGFAEYTVTLDQPVPSRPEFPELPATPSDLILQTTEDGLILKYQAGSLFSMENPGVYELFDLQLDPEGNLVGGTLLFENGDVLLYADGRAQAMRSSDGSVTYYNEDGAVALVRTAQNEEVRFIYRLDELGNIVSILTLEDSTTSLYDAQGRPLWILKMDGTDIRYDEDGFLRSYQDKFGNFFHFGVQGDRDNEGALTGYRSELISVTARGMSDPMDYEEISSRLEEFPEVQTSLLEEIPQRISYGLDGAITEMLTIGGESLNLEQGWITHLNNIQVNGSAISYDVLNQWDAQGGVLSLSLSSNALENNLDQIFNEEGHLVGIRLQDGTVLTLSDLSLERIELEDDSVITGIDWTGSSMRGYTRTYVDGSMDVYQYSFQYYQSYLEMQQDAQGNKTFYVLYSEPGKPVEHKPTEMHMTDGRVYKVIEFENADGAIERINELISMEIPDGGRLEFENGVPARYIQTKEVRLEASVVPELPNGCGYIPSLVFPELELRGITLDAVGNIISGEILYRDGTQHLIQDGKLYRQITPYGQVVEFDETPVPSWDPPALVSAEPLTAEELAYRDQLVEVQLDFFTLGIGLHALTGLPLDNFQGDLESPSDYSQATLVGFWAEILVAIAAGDYVTPKMTQTEAFQKLDQLITHYRQAQVEAGWNGMLAFFTIKEVEEPVLDEFGQPTEETRTVIHYENRFDQYGFGDILNLSVSLSSVIGALQGLSVEASLESYRDDILSKTQEILTAQEPGYAAFYDPAKKRFHGAYTVDPATGNGAFVTDYYIDRVFSEFRTGLIWLAAKYPQYSEAIDHIDVAFRSYETASGELIDNAVPWDGGAFQMFWPQIHVDETQYPEFEVALRNFLYTQAEFASENDLVGLLSAGANPGQGYEGKIGVPTASETDDLLHTNIGSLYGLASAFSIAPHYVLQFFKNIESLIPGIRTDFGFVDSIILQTQTITDPITEEETEMRVPVLASEYYGVDQASFVLSLLGTSQSYFSNYLDQHSIKDSFDALYEGLKLNLTPVVAGLPQPPDFGAATQTLYEGDGVYPDGTGYGLTKERAFISSFADPDYGEGKIYNYRTFSGAYHHTEIEFSSPEGSVTSMGLQEFLLLPGRGDAARSILEGITFDLFDEAKAQGAFYTSGHGFASSVSVHLPPIGEVQRVQFDFQEVTKPVGVWAQFDGIDLTQYDFISVPVKLASGTDAPMRIKFELKGMGEVYVSPPLTQNWQYLQIPIRKPALLLSEIAVVVQSIDGSPMSGEFFMGPLSAFKVRTSNTINWQVLMGKSPTELRSWLLDAALDQPGSGGIVVREEVLENFSVDSEGKIVSGVLRKANGEVQYYQRGMLNKWVFPNGRTVLFENGLATFVIDLVRGELQEARFYYDQSFLGEIRSFVIQDNDWKKVFNAQGELETLIEDGRFVNFENGAVSSIETSQATLSNITFGDDQRILGAHVTMQDGREFDIDQTVEQSIVTPDGAKLFYSGRQLTAIETPQNGRTGITYSYDALGRMTGVQASFQEAGENEPTVMSLASFLQMPNHSLERNYLIAGDPLSIIPISAVSGYSVGVAVDWRWVEARKQNEIFSDGSTCTESVCWNFGYNEDYPTIGMALTHNLEPVSLSEYDFLSITIRLDPNVTWPQDFVLSIKDGYWARYSYAIEGLGNEYQTLTIPLAGKAWTSSQLTLEIQQGDHDPQGIGYEGKVYLDDVSYFSVTEIQEALWEVETGIRDAEIQALKIEIDNLTSVGTHIASKTPLVYSELASFLDLPTHMIYSQASVGTDFELQEYRNFDGTYVELEGTEVSRVTLTDGTVNEYETTGNAATGAISDGSGGEEDGLEYSYGALRRIVQADGHEFEFSYEFDGSGNEITVIRDAHLGEERRFQDGELIRSNSPDEIRTDYDYENGVMQGATVFYKNRVLSHSQYIFRNNETLITDESGTTWFYDADGILLKHLTQEGYLFVYSDYEFVLGEDFQCDPADFKCDVYAQTGLRSVSLAGFEAEGIQVTIEGNGLLNIKFAGGMQGTNIKLDSERRIQNGQIQMPNGLVLNIVDYLPVEGRYVDGAYFNEATVIEGFTDPFILQSEDGTFEGIQYRLEDQTYTYDHLGRLLRVASDAGKTYLLDYRESDTGYILGYDLTEQTQASFNGVPFPQEVSFEADTTLRFIAEGEVITEREEDTGFIVAAWDEKLLQWKVFSGSFYSDGDRLQLKNFLTNLKAGQFVAMMVQDPHFSQAGDEIIVEGQVMVAAGEILDLLEGVGSGNIRGPSSNNDNWFFLGNETLELGEGIEQAGGTSFSSVTVTTSYADLTSQPRNGNVFTPLPEFQERKIFLANESYGDVLQAYSEFLVAFEPHKPEEGLHAVTVYNADSQIVFTQRVDGVQAYYENGKVRETYSAEGELLYVHEYGCPVDGDGESVCEAPEDEYLIRITMVQARKDLEEELIRMRDQIAQTEFDALYELALQENVAIVQIKQDVEDSRQALQDHIRYLESIRFQQVTQCQRGWSSEKCKTYTVEVPGVAGMISQAHQDRAELLGVEAEQIASIPGVIREKQNEIAAAVSARLLELDEQEAEINRDMLRREIEPVVSDLYRRLLGHDPSSERIEELVTQYTEARAVDFQALYTEILNSSERAGLIADKQTIIAGVSTFLTEYLAGDDAARLVKLQSLGLDPSEVVSLSQEEIDMMLEWLETRDLHFGQSAFLSLQTMLVSRGMDVPMTTIGTETILIDILTGVITKFEDGDLLISMFSLDRTAQLHGALVAGVRYTLEDLGALFAAECPDSSVPCHLRVIVHIGGDHFAVITNITDDEITFIETTKGKTAAAKEQEDPGQENYENGEEVTSDIEQFLKAWDLGDGTGHLIVFEDQVIQEKILSDGEAMRVRGAFISLIFIGWMIAASLVLSVASIAVSFVSPTWGRILGFAAMVVGIIAIVGAVANFVVEGAKLVLSQVANAGSLWGAISNGFQAIGTMLWESVKAVGNFIHKGFQFFQGGFTNSLAQLGQSISNLGGFLTQGAGGVLTDAAGNAVVNAAGTEVLKFTFTQQIARQLVATGVNYGVSKGLQGLGVDPRLCRLAGAFVSGGVVGIGADNTTFFKSGLQQYLLQGVNELGLHIGLPPPIIAGISMITQASLGSYFDGNLQLTNADITGLLPKVSSQFALGGIELIGRSLGLDPRLTTLIGLPVAASIGGIFSGIGNPQGIFDSIKDALFSAQTLGGFISLGASMGLEAIGAPAILQNFLPSLIGGLVSGTGNNGPPAEEQGQNIFSRIWNNVQKFGQGFMQVVGDVVGFGADMLANGFNAAVGMFSGLFSREVQQVLYEVSSSGAVGLGAGWERVGSIDFNGVKTTFYEDASGNTLEITGDAEANTLTVNGAIGGRVFEEIYENVSRGVQGGFSVSSVAFAQDSGTDGIRLMQEYNDGQLTRVKMFNGQDALLEMNPFGEHQPLTFANSGLADGVLSIYGNNPVEISMRDGIVNRYTALVSQNSYLGVDSVETFENVFVDLTRDASGNYLGEARIEDPFVDSVTGTAGVQERTVQLADIFFGGGINNPNESGVSSEYANLFVQEFSNRGVTLEAVPLFEGTNEITGVYQVAKEMFFTDPVNKDKIKEAILNRIEQQPLTPGEKLSLVLYSGAGQSGLEAAQELGAQYGIEFSNIVLLDTPVLINSTLSNVDSVHLVTGDRFNFENGVPSIGIAVPQIVNPLGGMNLESLLGFLKIDFQTIAGYDHFDFISEENIPAIVDMIQNLQQGDE